MTSPFSIRGHPLHPLFATVPIGLLTWALVANVIYAITDNSMWYDIAFWSGWAGIITVIPAAVSGLIDYVALAVRHQPGIATAHLALNVTATVLFVIAGLLSIDEGATGGTTLASVLVLQAIAVGMLAIGGWLGAELVYRHGLAVTPQAARASLDAAIAEAAEMEHAGEDDRTYEER